MSEEQKGETTEKQFQDINDSLRSIVRRLESVALPRKSYRSNGWIYWVVMPLMIVGGVLLLAVIASPVFLNFDTDGAIRYCAPWNKGTTVNEDTSVKITVDWSKDKEYSVELSGSGRVKLNLIDPSKHPVDIYDGETRHSFSLKYVNVAMAIAAYIFGIIFLVMILRGLCKAERRWRLLGECGGDFGKLLAASPDREKHQEAFLQEIMSLYFDKKEE